MKRPIIVLLMAVIFTATLLTSCKKEEKPESEREEIYQLLTSHKWYINHEKKIENDNHEFNCLGENYSMTFNNDGSFIEEWGGGTDNYSFTLSKDGKTLTLKDLDIYSLTFNGKNEFDIKHENFEYNLSTTPKACN